eukprot:CAMPEP_0202708500 /NCGR_PEP_ID=MMETSP1385-20130828/20687_1 /ASSEMBLY_ACC=CAM_ASM_000861 /TAXON_ID=933848 /ORGANISM="Elphidium margaritaceum" /LENGTH=181 /DNA_ID=CAMNT_0049367487 /DNA_START=100 /DNA_END=645 /DNA_ORIENTATION=-
MIGLGITGFGSYLQIEYGTYVVSVVTLTVGVFVSIAGLLGLCAVNLSRKKNWCLLTTYSALMVILFFANIAILILSFTSYDTLIDAVKTENSDVEKVQKELRHRKQIVQILQGVVVFVEFLCIWFSLMYRKHEGDMLQNGYQEFVGISGNDFIVAPEEEKVMTDGQMKRQAMREKYGLDEK